VIPPARTCGTCGATVVTVRCPTCFHLNVGDAPGCAGCGGPLGLEPIAEPARLACPACKCQLDAFPGDHGVLFDCGQCGGQFVEHPRLLDMLREREARAAVGRPGADARPALAPSPVRYLPCPACSALMNRKNFGRTSGVIVDICKEHGAWFDQGELPRVLAFAEHGGLARARARELEERTAEKERLRGALSALINPPSPPGSGCDGLANDGGLGLDLFDLLAPDS
jgi:Zn-finger nucleic acid-binding protein